MARPFFYFEGVITINRRTSELDAINSMLSIIGEAPLDSLDNGVLHADGAQARSILHRTSKQVQEEGWFFNREENFPLHPDSITQEIHIGNNVLSVDTEKLAKNITLRGNRLYDMTNHTYKFETTLNATLILYLPFEELPEVAKEYIVIRASRRFQAEAVGSETLHSLSEQDEYRARANLMSEHVNNIDVNFSDPTYNSMFGTSAIRRVTRRCL